MLKPKDSLKYYGLNVFQVLYFENGKNPAELYKYTTYWK